MRARILRRSGRLDGSSLQGWKGDGAVAAMLISSSVRPVASDDAESRLLNRRDQAPFCDGLGLVKDACLALAEGDRGDLHASQLFDKPLDGVGAVVAVHAFDFERRGFHFTALSKG